MATASKKTRNREPHHEWIPVKGFPTSSPIIGAIPSRPLTNRAIKKYALEGRYGQATKELYEEAQKRKPIPRQNKVKQLISDLLS